MSERAGRRLRIHGVVQGVGFRYALEREARRLGLSGWVRNRRDGTVEAVIEGPVAAVEAMAAWAHRGPPSARVARVEVTEDGGGFTDFQVHPTA